MSTDQAKWYVIVNPNAGRKRGEKDWKLIRQLLTDEGFEFDSMFTEQMGHAMKLVKQAIEDGYRNLIVVGGDGTMNEAINGMFSQDSCATKDITIGMIPVGTGNDWGRMYQIPTKYKNAVKIIKKRKVYTQDAGRVTYYDGSDEKCRHFINMAGMGYDALVAEKTNKMKQKGGGGTLAYLINLLLGLFQYKNTYFDITVDGELKYSGKLFSMSIGICQYNGGGMKQLPFAIPNDGLLDVTIIKQTSKFTVVSNLKNLYDGSFVKLPMVDTFSGKDIQIASRPQNSVYLETDGESMGHSPLHFTVVPESVNVIVNSVPSNRRDS